jgi:hypothetical protein
MGNTNYTTEENIERIANALDRLVGVPLDGDGVLAEAIITVARTVDDGNKVLGVISRGIGEALER